MKLRVLKIKRLLWRSEFEVSVSAPSGVTEFLLSEPHKNQILMPLLWQKWEFFLDDCTFDRTFPENNRSSETYSYFVYVFL